MTARENLLRVLRFDNPEYIPYYSAIPLREIGHALFLGTHPQRGHRWRDANGDELEDLSVSLSKGRSGTWRDIWGVKWGITSDDLTPYPLEHPIVSLSDVAEYEFPAIRAALWGRRWAYQRSVVCAPA